MARARNIKPSFFKNLQLAECSPLARLLFIGLWTMADREGRLRDQPRLIKAECLPYEDCDCDALLQELQHQELIVRYELDGQTCIWIPKFSKHQNPHKQEKDSELPEFKGVQKITEQVPKLHHTKSEAVGPLTESLLLNPESFNPITRKPDKSGNERINKKETPHVPNFKEFLNGVDHIPAEWANWCSTELGWSQSRIDETFGVFSDYYLYGKGKSVRGPKWFDRFKGWCRKDHRPQSTSAPGGRMYDKTAAAVSSVVANRYGRMGESGGNNGRASPENGTDVGEGFVDLPF